jgi:hypothetical protein
VVVSASFAWTTIRSSSGLIATFVAVVTGIPSWGIWIRDSEALRRRRRGCRRRPGLLSTHVPRVLSEVIPDASTPSRRVPNLRGSGSGRIRQDRVGPARRAAGSAFVRTTHRNNNENSHSDFGSGRRHYVAELLSHPTISAVGHLVETYGRRIRCRAQQSSVTGSTHVCRSYHPMKGPVHA